MNNEPNSLLHSLRWPLVALAGIAAAVWVVVAGFGEQLGVSHVLAEQVSDAAAWVGSVAIPFLIRLALRDRDGDGTPDLLDSTPHGSPVPPPPRPPSDTIAALLAVCVAAAPLAHGCGASALDRHTSASGAARTLQASVVQSIRIVITEDVESECAGLPEGPRDVCVDRVIQTYRSAETATEIVAEALDAWALALFGWAKKALAGELDEDTPPPRVCELSEFAIEQVLRLAGDHNVAPQVVGLLEFDLDCDTGDENDG